ncbi:MAG: type I-U CRISPR-associated helicase/endonuclease Cas3, partial [Myxococcota bacterium]
MATRDMPELTVSFSDFFREVWGYDPFPWQVRLAALLDDTGAWPQVLDLPTGSGKTAALDIALFDFIRDGGRRAARRIVMVVDRRVIVDQIAERAKELHTALIEPRGPATQACSDRLRGLLGRDADNDTTPLLQTAVLRGAVVRDDSWARYPHVPVLGASTVDQVGSRLLFRGYGVRDGVLPIHAGLIGCDTLLLLDEVHLARPFAELLHQTCTVRERFIKSNPVPGRFAYAELSATPDATSEPFVLEDADRAHPVLAQRIGAAKPTRLERVTMKGDETQRRQRLAEAATKAASKLVNTGHMSVAIIVNRVETASIAATLLEENQKVDSALLTGRMRPFDQQMLLDRIRDRVIADRESQPERPFVLVATQCIEAGADFDFEGMVTQCASLDALRQRFGRLNRRGNFQSEGVILMRTDQTKGDDPVYGNSLAETWVWLEETEAKAEGLDFGIEALEAHLPQDPELAATLRPPARETAVVLPGHFDLWSQTRPKPAVDPDLEPFLHGICADRPPVADIQVVWREDLELDDDGDGISEILDAIPPGSLEAMSLPPWAVRAWLETGAGSELTDVEGQVAPKDGAPGDLKPFWVRELGSQGRWSESTHANRLRPGTTIVVPTSYGGIGRHGTIDASATQTVVDLGDIVQLVQRGRPVLRLSPSVTPSLFTEGGDRRRPKPPEDQQDPRAEVVAIAEAYLERDHAALPWWRTAIDGVLSRQKRFVTVEGISGRWWVVGRKLGPKELRDLLEREKLGDQAAAADATTEATSDAGSHTGRRVDLEAHLLGVADYAERYALACGLAPSLVSTLRWAGRLHDIGKADPRFQAMLHDGDPVATLAALEQGRHLAKSGTSWTDRATMRRSRALARYPAGQRHELVSAAMMIGTTELRDALTA